MVSPSSAPCRSPARRHRCKRRACCCVGFILLLNLMALMHTGHILGMISYFMMNGSYDHHDTTYLFVPGGPNSFCNDLCVEMCVYQEVNCEVASCLNSCHDQLKEEGNEHDEFQHIAPQVTHESDLVRFDGDDEMFMEPMTTELDDMEEEYQDVVQMQLDAMQEKLVNGADRVRELKQKYSENCSDPAQDGTVCSAALKAITNSIDELKRSVEGFNSFTLTVKVDIKVQVFIPDIDEVTTSP